MSATIIATIISAVSAGICSICDAFRSNAKEVPSNPDSKLQFEITKLNKEIAVLRSRANADEVNYEQIRQFVNKKRFKVHFNKGKMALMGPKGAGKSTWLWLRGGGPKPENVVGDGTLELELSHSIDCVDTVGSDFHFHSVMKFLACLIFTDHFPDTLIVCCNSHCVKQAVTVLASLGVSKFYIVCLNVESAHNLGNVPSAYNSAVYSAISSRFPGVIPVGVDTEIGSVDSFEHTRDVFHQYKVRMDDYATYRRNQGSQDVTRYWVCRYIYELNTVHGGNVQEFLNK